MVQGGTSYSGTMERDRRENQYNGKTDGLRRQESFEGKWKELTIIRNQTSDKDY